MGKTKQSRRKKFILGLLITIICCGMSLTSVFAAPQDEISAGEDALWSETIDGILLAHSIFSNAQSAYPQDPVINGYLALTRLLHLALTSQSGGLQELLSMYGILRMGLDLDTLEYQFPKTADNKYNLPVTAPDTESVRLFISEELLDAIDASINNLNTTLSVWTDASKHIVAKEKLGSFSDLEIDTGDMFLFRAALQELKSLAMITSAYDVSVDPREIAALINIDAFSERDFLNRYQNFLKLLPTAAAPAQNGADWLDQARLAMIGAIDDYIVASGKIRSDDSLNPGAEELFEIDECDFLLEEWYRNILTSIKDSLAGISSPITDIVESEEYWLFTDQTTGDQILVFFDQNKSRGDFVGLGGIFGGSEGEVECVQIDGSQIEIEIESNGWQYLEIAFSGTLNDVNGTMSGTYSGLSWQGSLTGNFSAQRVDAELTSTTINLNPFFGNGSGPYNLRDFLPQLDACDNWIAGTVGYGLNPSTPDATLGGILPDYSQADWKIEAVPCVPAGDSSVSGTLSIPGYDGQGPIYLQIFQYAGQTGMDFDARLSIQVIYPDEFSEGMIYNLLNVPAGVQAYVSAWWDADSNGIVTSADRVKYSSSFTTQSGTKSINFRLIDNAPGALPWIYLLLIKGN